MILVKPSFEVLDKRGLNIFQKIELAGRNPGLYDNFDMVVEK